MVLRANAGTVKDATATSSPVKSMLRENAPQLRTVEAILSKEEQILDALEHNRITGKVAEQMNQTIKGIVGLEKLGIQYLGLLLKFRRKVPVPRTPIVRNLIGLSPVIASTDDEFVQGLLPEGK